MIATSGFSRPIQSRAGPKPSKNGFQYGSCSSPLAIAPPMAGMCDVASAPMILAMIDMSFSSHRFGLFVLGDEASLERLLAHAGLGGAEVLHVEAEDAGELSEIVDIAAGREQAEHVARPDRLRLLAVEAVGEHVGLFVGPEGGAIRRVVEGEAHLVERVAALGHRAIERRRAEDFSQCGHWAPLLETSL